MMVPKIIVMQRPNGELEAVSPFYNYFCAEQHEGRERPIEERIDDLTARVRLSLKDFHNGNRVVLLVEMEQEEAL